jgi:helicase MOV-10
MVVVVSTTRSAAQLVNAGVPKGHFTHIIVDEAAQLMEAEALLPISLAGPHTAVIMAGDPRQLGPSTFSKVDSAP